MFRAYKQPLVFIFFLVAFFFPVFYSHADTIVGTDITTNTTWDTTGSPYIISSTIHVNSGATLTVDPGVVVQFDDGEIYVNGSVVADASSGSTIFFTSVADTALPGSSIDESYVGLTPAPGDYAGFVLYGGASATFSNIDMRYADTAITGYGVAISITNSRFSNSNFGVVVYDGTFDLANNTFSHNTVPLQVNYGAVFTHSGNSFSDNIYDGIGMVDNPSGDYTYLGGDAPYILFSTPQILEGWTLTVQPGVTIESNEDYNYISLVGGVLNAAGEPSNRIIFDGVSIQAILGGVMTLQNADIKNIAGTAVYVWNEGSAHFDRVTIDSVSGDGINVFNTGNLDLENSTISHFSGTGIVAYNTAVIAAENSTINSGFVGVSVFNDVSFDANALTIQHCTNAGFLSYGGEDHASSLIRLRNSEITANATGFYLIGNTNVDISQNTISDNEYGVYNGESETLDFSHNWWGDNSGPQNDSTNPEGLGNVVSDQVIFDPWVHHSSTLSGRNPVLIVPGVLGTEINQSVLGGSPIKLWLDLVRTAADYLFGDTFMDPLEFNEDLTPSDTSLYLDGVLRRKTGSFAGITLPIFDYTSGLFESLSTQGYVENEDLFTFPYDWRYGVNEDAVTQLKDRITAILSATGSTTVDIVAHSTGGLLVKKYAIENSGNTHIGKAVFVGVPNTGAPKAVKVLVQGDSFGIPFLSQDEMQRIAKNLPVVYDLSPSHQYYDIKGSYIKIVNQHFFTSTNHLLDFDQSNDYLTGDHGLNMTALANAHMLHTSDFDNYDLRTAGVDLYAVDGCRTGTIAKFVEVRADTLLGGTAISYNAPTEKTGDGTVPLESATNLPIDLSHKYYALRADHAQMMSQSGIRQQIVNILTGATLSTDDAGGHHLITQDIGQCNLAGHAISVYSPLAVTVIDQDGNRAGVTSVGSTENTIPNADYEIMGEHKFVYLPNNEGQIYTISLQGTGAGTFTLTDATIANDEVTQTQVFKHIPVTTSLVGVVSSGESTTLNLDTNNDGTIDRVLQPSFVLNAMQSIDFNPQEEDRPDGQDNISQSIVRSNGHSIVSNTNILNWGQAENKVSHIDNKEKIIPVSVTSSSTKNTKSTLLEVNSIESIIYENKGNSAKLLAAAVGSGLPLNKRFVLEGILGIVVLVLIRKKFLKW